MPVDGNQGPVLFGGGRAVQRSAMMMEALEQASHTPLARRLLQITDAEPVRLSQNPEPELPTIRFLPPVILPALEPAFRAGEHPRPRAEALLRGLEEAERLRLRFLSRLPPCEEPIRETLRSYTDLLPSIRFEAFGPSPMEQVLHDFVNYQRMMLCPSLSVPAWTVHWRSFSWRNLTRSTLDVDEDRLWRGEVPYWLFQAWHDGEFQHPGGEDPNPPFVVDSSESHRFGCVAAGPFVPGGRCVPASGSRVDRSHHRDISIDFTLLPQGDDHAT